MDARQLKRDDLEALIAHLDDLEEEDEVAELHHLFCWAWTSKVAQDN